MQRGTNPLLHQKYPRDYKNACFLQFDKEIIEAAEWSSQTEEHQHSSNRVKSRVRSVRSFSVLRVTEQQSSYTILYTVHCRVHNMIVIRICKQSHTISPQQLFFADSGLDYRCRVSGRTNSPAASCHVQFRRLWRKRSSSRSPNHRREGVSSAHRAPNSKAVMDA